MKNNSLTNQITQVMKTPLSLLHKFVCTYRKNMKFPHLDKDREDRVIVTNGRVLISIDKDEIENDTGYEITPIADFPNYIQIFDVVIGDKIPCPIIEAIGEEVRCENCNGKGEINCCTCGQTTECDDCDGEGFIAPKWETIIDTRIYQNLYLAELIKLPSVQFQICSVGLYFTFGESGQGLIAGIPTREKP